MALSDREARAMAYALCDEIETRALGVMRDFPQVKSKAQAMAIVIEAMARLADRRIAKRKESGNG